MSPAWFLAPLAALWGYALLSAIAIACPAVASALMWIPAIGPYSGKVGLAIVAFAAVAAGVRRPPRSWEVTARRDAISARSRRHRAAAYWNVREARCRGSKESAAGEQLPWERWALVLPGLYAAALLASFPPVATALAQALRLALAW